MNTDMGRAAIGTLFLFIMTALGSCAVFMVPDRKRSHSGEMMMGFSGGVMSAALVWSMTVPAIELTGGWLIPSLGILLGTGFLCLGDLAVEKLSGYRGDGALLFTAITLHNVPEGIAVALSCAMAGSGEALASAAALALGIGIQNIPEGAAVSLPLCTGERGRGRSFLMGVLSGAVEPVFGMLGVLAAKQMQQLLPWLLSFSAGAMMYAVTSELVPRCRGRKGCLAYTVGFAVMMTLDVMLG